jgi:hypothetical protein
MIATVIHRRLDPPPNFLLVTTHPSSSSLPFFFPPHSVLRPAPLPLSLPPSHHTGCERYRDREEGPSRHLPISPAGEEIPRGRPCCSQVNREDLDFFLIGCSSFVFSILTIPLLTPVLPLLSYLSISFSCYVFLPHLSPLRLSTPNFFDSSSPSNRHHNLYLNLFDYQCFEGERKHRRAAASERSRGAEGETR